MRSHTFKRGDKVQVVGISPPGSAGRRGVVSSVQQDIVMVELDGVDLERNPWAFLFDELVKL